MRRNTLGLVFGVTMLAACGTGGTTDNPDASTNPDGASSDGDGGVPPGFTKLIGRTWSLTAGQTDTYRCVQITVPQDMYITAFHAQAPQGTHHTVLTITNAPQHADGEWNCSALSLDFQMLFASGVGTDDLAFPDGVAVRVPAGYHATLNLHLFDATDGALAGETAIYVKTLPTAPDAQHLAEMIFSGTFNINVPNDGQTHTADGGCTLASDYNLVALWPHMHQTGVHQLVTLTPSGSSTPTTLLDKPYSFSEQKNYPWTPPIQVHTGDKIWTTCSYVNNGPMPLMFGESSTAEMCFTGMYRYPATGDNLFSCTTGTPF